jgi:hypothetical protein
MTVERSVKRWVEKFDRPLTLTTTPEGGTGWTMQVDTTAGTPTYATITEDGGALQIQLANNTEIERVGVYHNDILVFPLEGIDYVWYIAKVAAIGATTVCTMGIGSARDDDEDAVAVNAYFKMEGATSTTAVEVETDDGTNDTASTSNGVTLAAVYKKMLIDFTNGLSDVRFFFDGARIADGTTFDMSNITAGQNVQPIIQLEKGATAGQPTLTIAEFGIQYNAALGA